MRIARVFFGGLALFASSQVARAADKSDIYLEGYFGSRIASSAALLLGADLGYVVADSVGIGFTFNQIFASRSTQKIYEGSEVGAEGRLFFEPFEISGSAGAIFRDILPTKGYIAGSGAYLFALTPALALRAEGRARYILGEQTLIFADLGFRLIF